MFLGDSRRIKKDVVWKKYRSKKHFIYFHIMWYKTQHAYHFSAVSLVASRRVTQHMRQTFVNVSLRVT